MGLETRRALVLRTTAANDRDRYLLLLAADGPPFEAYAKAAMGKKSRLAAATEAFSYTEFVLFVNKGRRWVDQAQFIYPFRALKQSLEAQAVAAHLAELCQDLFPAGETGSEQLLPLLLHAFYALESASESAIPELLNLAHAAELRLLSLAGYAPETELPSCHAPEAGELAGPDGRGGVKRLCFDFARSRFVPASEGAQLEREWRPERGRQPGEAPRFRRQDGSQWERYVGSAVRPFSWELYRAVRYMLLAPLPQLFRFRCGAELSAELEAFCEDYRTAVLEKPYRHLAYLRDLAPVPALEARRPDDMRSDRGANHAEL